MNFTDPLLNDRNFSIPELEREQEAMQQKIAEKKLSAICANDFFSRVGRNRQDYGLLDRKGV